MTLILRMLGWSCLSVTTCTRYPALCRCWKTITRLNLEKKIKPQLKGDCWRMCWSHISGVTWPGKILVSEPSFKLWTVSYCEELVRCVQTVRSLLSGFSSLVSPLLSDPHHLSGSVRIQSVRSPGSWSAKRDVEKIKHWSDVMAAQSPRSAAGPVTVCAGVSLHLKPEISTVCFSLNAIPITDSSWLFLSFTSVLRGWNACTGAPSSTTHLKSCYCEAFKMHCIRFHLNQPK